MNDEDNFYHDAGYEEGFKDGKQEAEYIISIEILSLEKEVTALQEKVNKLTKLQDNTSDN